MQAVFEEFVTSSKHFKVDQLIECFWRIVENWPKLQDLITYHLCFRKRTKSKIAENAKPGSEDKSGSTDTTSEAAPEHVIELTDLESRENRENENQNDENDPLLNDKSRAKQLVFIPFSI